MFGFQPHTQILNVKMHVLSCPVFSSPISRLTVHAKCGSSRWICLRAKNYLATSPPVLEHEIIGLCVVSMAQESKVRVYFGLRSW